MTLTRSSKPLPSFSGAMEFHCFDEFLGMKSRNDVEWFWNL